MEQLTLWSAERPVRDSASRDGAAALPTNAADWPCDLLGLFLMFVRAGSSGRTSPELFQLREVGTSGHSSGRWTNAGIVSHGACLTLTSSEYPSNAVESSLSDILETGALPQRFFLSRAACAGILRRAAKRGTTFPEALRLALEAGAATSPASSDRP